MNVFAHSNEEPRRMKEKNTNTRAINKKNIIKLLTNTNDDNDGDGDDAEINDANVR